MAKTPNFRRSQVPPPPPGTALPDTGGKPLPSAQVTMTPWTRQMLESMGWKDGDPIPGDIGTKLQSAIKNVQEQGGHPLGEAPPPGSRAKVGASVNFEDLPPEKQAELRQAMADAKAYEEAKHNSPRARAERDIPETISPGAREAAISAREAEILREDAARVNAPPAEGPEVVINGPKRPDFRKSPEPAPQPEAPPEEAPPARSAEEIVAALPEGLQPRAGAQVASVSGIAPFVTDDIPKPQRTAPPPPPKPEPEPEPEHIHDDGAGGGLPLTRCPRCMWNMSANFEADPTAEDRMAFVATILGTDRFRKTYDMMGGRFRVTFRSLTADETDLVFRQMRLDQLRGEILGDADYFGRLNTYRLALMVESIADGNGTLIADVPPVMDIPYDEPEFGSPNKTRLIPMLEWFNSEVCKTESLRRITSMKHREFQRLMEALEAQTSEADFWEGIG